ncbi:MAG: FG-GAP-like repeat-containing protein [Candidatus Eiseniibacteriota bacterium]
MLRACSKAPRVTTPFATLFLALATCFSFGPSPAVAVWSFTDATVAAGLNVSHSMTALGTQPREQCGGAACADYNDDGWLDLYFVGGDGGSNALLRNNGNGTFTDVAVAAGVDRPGVRGSGACFADWDGDGDSDLITGGFEGAGAKLFRNNGNGTFTDVTVASGVALSVDTWSQTFADHDRDGDLDLFTTHWGVTPQGTGHIWRNNGDGTFTDADVLCGYTNFPPVGGDNGFTFSIADYSNDGWPDLLAASDFLTSHVFRSDGDGTFTNVTNPVVIKDDNGMGSAVGDYDNDGDLDWFVSSIYNFPFKIGNRLYRNDAGTFADVTPTAGVANGSWAWGSTMQDFNNDGLLDIYHVNGWRAGFSPDRCRLFQNNGNGTFADVSAATLSNPLGEGRGVVAFDCERDGDLDIFIANNDEPAIFLRNDGLTANWLSVKLVGPPPNTEQVGARVRVTIGATTQMRELSCGSNYVSADPVEAHFGLNAAATVNTLQVTWTDGTVATLNNVAANQRLVLTHPAVDAPIVASPNTGSLELLGAAPNPFDRGTAIRFRMGEASGVQVRVFDAAGRAVRTVVTGSRGAGSHEITWDGRDDEGSAVGSGVYWYEVRTDRESARGKLVRLR